MQKRKQQAKQAPWSNKLSVLDTHKLLKEHLRMATPPPCPAPPGFHVGKRGKKTSAVSLQVEALVPMGTYLQGFSSVILLHLTCLCASSLRADKNMLSKHPQVSAQGNALVSH